MKNETWLDYSSWDENLFVLPLKTVMQGWLLSIIIVKQLMYLLCFIWTKIFLHSLKTHQHFFVPHRPAVYMKQAMC